MIASLLMLAGRLEIFPSSFFSLKDSGGIIDSSFGFVYPPTKCPYTVGGYTNHELEFSNLH
jgi:hypothetical protein